MESNEGEGAVVASTATEDSLFQLLDHMEEWGIETEIVIEARNGKWVATLLVPSHDPRRAKFMDYLNENGDFWVLGTRADDETNGAQ